MRTGSSFLIFIVFMVRVYLLSNFPFLIHSIPLSPLSPPSLLSSHLFCLPISSIPYPSYLLISSIDNLPGFANLTDAIRLTAERMFELGRNAISQKTTILPIRDGDK